MALLFWNVSSVSATVRRVVLSTDGVTGLLCEALRLRQPEQNTVHPSFIHLKIIPGSVHEVPQVAVVGSEVKPSQSVVIRIIVLRKC